MVKSNDSSKVIKVLEIVLNDCLSVNRDDTLIEKLFTFLRHDLDLSSDEKQSVLKCLEKSIELSLKELKTNNDCSDWPLIAIKLRICGSLLADKDLFVCQQNCLQFLQIISTEVINSTKSSLKFSFFSCLNDICVHRLARNWALSTSVANSQTIPQLLWCFLNRSETRFVDSEVLKVFITLLNHSLSETVLSQDFDPIIAELISSANPSNIEILREIIVSIESKNQFIEKYGITESLVQSIDVWRERFSDKVFILSQIIGICAESEGKAIEISDKLLAFNDLKAFLGFLTEYIKNHKNFGKTLSQKWFNYTIGWFAVKCQQKDCFDLPISVQTFLDTLSDKTLNDFCLKQIMKIDFNCFEDKEIETIIKLISKLIEINHQNKEMRKNILQSFCVLERIAFNSDLKTETTEELLSIYSHFLQFISNDFKFTVLKTLRDLIPNKVSPKTYSSDNRVFNELNEQLIRVINQKDDNENNWEIIDSTLEVIYSLFSSLSRNGIQLSPLCSQLLSTVLSIWKTKEEDICSTIRSTLVSVLILIHLNSSFEDLKELSLKSDVSEGLPSLTSLLLSDELIVRFNIIKTFDENIESLVAIESRDKQMLENIIKTICRLTVDDLDEDLQGMALKLLQKLFHEMSQRNQISATIHLFFSSYYFHVIFHLIHGSEYLFKVKQICVQTIGYFQNKLGEFGQPLEPLINSLPIIASDSDPKFSKIVSIGSEVIFKFIMSFDIKSFEDNESEDIPQLNVLDDILSVALIDTNILIDCY